MSKDVTGIIAWLRQWFDDIYAPKGQGGSITLDDVYPVGSIYMSTNTVNPASLFGGTWEQIEDKFLLSSGSNYANGATGGEATHTLTTTEMPSHNHTQTAHSHGTGNSTYTKFMATNQDIQVGSTKRALTSANSSGYCYVVSSNTSAGIVEQSGTASATPTIQNNGGGGAHNNMPPYLVVNVWKRTA